MRKLALTYFLILLTLIMAGCTKTVDEYTDKETNIAAKYLRQQGYEILEYKHGRTHVLLKSMLLSHPHLPVWSVQTEDVSIYLKKKVSYETFEVTNHPLDTWKTTMGGETVQAKGRTTVLVIVVGNKAIGGTALPVTDIPLGGLIFSLDGRTLEDIHSKSYAEWLEDWQTRFR